MKGIRKILLIHRVERPVNPLFEAILRQAVLSDLTLLTAGVCTDSAEIDLSEEDIVEDRQPLPAVQSVLYSLGFQNYSYQSKNIKLQPHLIDWAELILVPDSEVEDRLCRLFPQALSKTIELSVYVGKTLGDQVNIDKLQNGTGPESENDYLSIAITFQILLPFLINRIKDTYAGHLIVKGKCFVNNKNVPFGATIIGNACVVKSGKDLLHFTPGNILVTDQLGEILKSNLNTDTCVNVINKLATSPVFYTCRDTQIRAKSQELTAVMKSPQSDGETIIKTKKPVMPKVQTIFPDADNTIEIVVRNAKAVVCSRGTGGTTFYDIPYIYSCIGATELIRDNQLIIVDSARGEVYDPAHFGQSKQNGLLIAH
jgi:phosphohistidine swiveling domain-containing protein